MTIKFNDIYLKEVSAVAGKDEKEGTYGSLYDITYDDYYIDQDTFEQAEMKMIDDSVNKVLEKANTTIENIDVMVGADLLNQVTAHAYSSVKTNTPYIGIYSACASLCEEFIVAGSILTASKCKNALVNVSSHNMTSERQFRNPVEYGAPKPKRSTFTVTGSASAILSREKSKIKVSSVTIGKTTDLGVTDVYDMGSVMTPSAARTIYDHLANLNETLDSYDLILTGDLGVYGKELLIKYMKETYNIDLKGKLEDSASQIYDREKQKKVNAGGSGPSCIGLVCFTDIIAKMLKGGLNKVLLVATGALMSPTMNNQKLSIPSISHAACLEVLK